MPADAAPMSADRDELARIIAAAWACSHGSERTLEETIERRKVLATRFQCSGEAGVIADAVLSTGFAKARWEPIESAPKDGTEINLGRFVRHCAWGKNGFTAYDRWHKYEEGFTGWGKFNNSWPPTHWKPKDWPEDWQPTIAPDVASSTPTAQEGQ